MDAAMKMRDGCLDLSQLRVNAVLAVSLAVTITAGPQLRTRLWRLLDGRQRPMLVPPMFNVFSGGHACGVVDIPDVLIIPLEAANFSEVIGQCWRAPAAIVAVLNRRGGSSGPVYGEGGVSAPLPTNGAGLVLVADRIEASDLEQRSEAGLALDVAARQLRDGVGYRFDVEGERLTTAHWRDRLVDWCWRTPVVSTKDPSGRTTAGLGRGDPSPRWPARVRATGPRGERHPRHAEHRPAASPGPRTSFRTHTRRDRPPPSRRGGVTPMTNGSRTWRWASTPAESRSPRPSGPNLRRSRVDCSTSKQRLGTGRTALVWRSLASGRTTGMLIPTASPGLGEHQE